jgi:hypothetical protein
MRRPVYKTAFVLFLCVCVFLGFVLLLCVCVFLGFVLFLCVCVFLGSEWARLKTFIL